MGLLTADTITDEEIRALGGTMGPDIDWTISAALANVSDYAKRECRRAVAAIINGRNARLAAEAK